MQRLVIKYLDKDVSDDCDIVDGKSNPFGWSQYKIVHGDKKIGWLESGYPMDMIDGYTAEIIQE